MLFSELKSHLKQLANDIKAKKQKRKGSPGGYVPGLQSDRYEYRHHHIAYCQLRGRTREEIEKPAEDNKPSDHYIDKIMEETTFPIKEEIHEEALCSG